MSFILIGYFNLFVVTEPVLTPAHEHLGYFAIMMVKEEAFAGVEFGNLRHILIA